MNSQDARIARIYTTQTGNKVADPTPNAPDVAGKPAATAYDLVVEIEAGNNVIDNAPYTLLITVLDDTTGTAVTALDPAVPAQKFASPPFALAPAPRPATAASRQSPSVGAGPDPTASSGGIQAEPHLLRVGHGKVRGVVMRERVTELRCAVVHWSRRCARPCRMSSRG